MSNRFKTYFFTFPLNLRSFDPGLPQLRFCMQNGIRLLLQSRQTSPSGLVPTLTAAFRYTLYYNIIYIITNHISISFFRQFYIIHSSLFCLNLLKKAKILPMLVEQVYTYFLILYVFLTKEARVFFYFPLILPIFYICCFSARKIVTKTYNLSHLNRLFFFSLLEYLYAVNSKVRDTVSFPVCGQPL